MPNITQQHLNILFTPLSNYGYRGNSALWALLEESLAPEEFCLPAEALIKKIIHITKQVVVDSLMEEIKLGQVHTMNLDVLQRFELQIHHNYLSDDKRTVDPELEIKLGQIVDTVLDHKASWAARFDRRDEECELLGALAGRYEPCLFVSGLNRGGMSGGGFDVRIWTESMLPVLIQRCEDLEQGLAHFDSFESSGALFVGDVHGRKDKLDTFLQHASWTGGEELLVFVGDLIDNAVSPKIDHIGLLQWVKESVDNRHAVCLLGNHEFNAIGWFLTKANGEPYRTHSQKNRKQHDAFLQEVGEGSQQHQFWIEWFQSLPLFVNFGEFGAVHACWDQKTINNIKPYLNPNGSLKKEHWKSAFDPKHELYKMIEILLKGPEVSLPKGGTFKDRNGNDRSEVRVAWWKESYSSTYRDIAVVAEDQRQNIPAVKLARDCSIVNTPPPIPVFIGHYSLAPTEFPELLSSKVACVDFNAASKDNPLVALYTWKEESDEEYTHNILDAERFNFANQPIPTRMVDNGITQAIQRYVDSYSPIIRNTQFTQLVHDILFKEWDPIGVFDEDDMMDDMADEYAAYEESVTRIAQAGERDSLAGHLALIQTHLMGMDVKDGGLVCARVAHKLVEAWKHNGADDFDLF
ncbi:metallophosphoesterase [Vibrio breoganii]|uniref:metallophosphoesterase n=1 Tax=Vibrio breoganii TaxID=553239 RepID=UPI000CA890C8|nr:metallophosphoesterase [Vibrio breoganii]PMO71474.1 hypothetical protein BCT02_15785 [Vibrio breoganii]PMO85987.1 hypothetical protein BCS99_13205 [Vibrio breoganii]